MSAKSITSGGRSPRTDDTKRGRIKRRSAGGDNGVHLGRRMWHLVGAGRQFAARLVELCDENRINGTDNGKNGQLDGTG